MSGYVTVICALVGALVYALVVQSKLAELGRLVFFAAMIAIMIAFSGHMAHLF